MEIATWLRKPKSGKISSEKYLLYPLSLHNKYNGTWKVAFVYYATSFFVLKENRDISLKDKEKMKGIKFIYNLHIAPFMTSRHISLVLYWLIKKDHST